MGDSAAKLPPLPDREPEVDTPEEHEAVVKHADIAITGGLPSQVEEPLPKRKYSLTMFPQRIEQASQSSLIFILLAIFGFACGVGVMILMLQ